MSFEITPYAVASGGAATVAAIVALFAWRRRGTPGSRPLALMMTAVALWCAAYALEYAAVGIPAKLFWAKVEYIGGVSFPVFFLLLALEYNHMQIWLTRRNVAILFAIPAATLLLAVTNEWHHLIWTSFTVSPAGPNLLVYGHGPAYWLGAIGYSYLAIFVGTILFAWAAVRFPSAYRRQAQAVLVGALVPWAGSLLYISGWNPAPGLEPTPIAMAFSGAVFAWSIFGLRLLDLAPVAREALVETTTDGMLVLDTQRRIVDMNPAAQSLLHVNLTEVLGRPAAEIFVDWPAAGEIGTSLPDQVELRLESEGQIRYLDVHCTPLRRRPDTAQDAATGQLLLLRDITRHKEAAMALRASQRKYQQLVELLQEGLCIVDLEGRILFVNPRMGEMLGYAPTDLLGRNLFAFLGQDWQNHIDVKFQRQDGSHFYATLVTSPISDDEGHSQGTLFGIIDITERKLMEDRLHDLSLVDELTGLHNRRGFQMLANQELKVADRLHQNLALLYVDLDRMKWINDTWGHNAGDDAIRDAARLLRTTLRVSDIVARIGGDEFVALVLEVKENSVDEIVARLMNHLAALNAEPARAYPISLSIGAAHYDPLQPCSLETLLDRGDQLMYAQKLRKSGESPAGS